MQVRRKKGRKSKHTLVRITYGKVCAGMVFCNKKAIAWAPALGWARHLTPWELKAWVYGPARRANTNVRYETLT